MDDLTQLAAALNGHQVTDENGEVKDETETSAEDTAIQEEKPTEEQSATAEKPAESEKAEPKSEESETETELAEDDSGKRYVPESRLKKETARFRATERELKALQAKLAQGDELLRQVDRKADFPITEALAKIDKADVIELRLTLPQFDPKLDEEGVPTNPNYSEVLDKLGYQIYKANPGMSLVDAGRKAIRFAKSLAQKQVDEVVAARKVKALQSDQGITNRATSRGQQSPDVDAMSDQDMERYLKENGMW